MVKKVTKKAFVKYIEHTLSFEEYDTIQDEDDIIDINVLFDIINKEFDIIEK
jgi:hypothetical protein